MAEPPAGSDPHGRHWLGMVVPKRHARRSVTRSLLKRQMREALSAAVGADGQGLAPGLWVLRLKAGFDRAAFPSAASDALRRTVRDELRQLMQRAAARGPSRP